jgi:hypothetical protein
VRWYQVRSPWHALGLRRRAGSRHAGQIPIPMVGGLPGERVPFAGKKKGADSGIDGLIYFKPEGKTTEKAIVSAKGGDNVNVAMVRDLAHVVDREKAKTGVFIRPADSSGPMRTEAVKAGFYETLYGKYPKLQILTIRELFDGKQPNIPLVESSFTKAPKESQGDRDALPF